jgi:GMP synthase (glutamine-hydrolysing)
MSRNAVIYVHEPHVPPLYLAEALKQAGFSLTLRLRETRPEDVEAPLLVVMGGSMGVYEADAHPFLKDAMRVMEARLAAGRPMVGVCLGSQLLASVAGSRVYPGKAGLELGVEPIRWSEAGRKDPALGALARECSEDGMRVTQWHGDTFDPVPGAALLASSSRYAWQAYRLGTSYGLQFHPELDEATLLQWARTWPQQMERAGVSWARFEREVLPAFQAARPGMLRLCDSLARFYAGMLG